MFTISLPPSSSFVEKRGAEGSVWHSPPFLPYFLPPLLSRFPLLGRGRSGVGLRTQRCRRLASCSSTWGRRSPPQILLQLDLQSAPHGGVGRGRERGESSVFTPRCQCSPPPLANLLDSSPPSFQLFRFPHILLFFPPLSAATSHRASIHVQVIPCTSNSKNMFNFYFRLRNVSMIFKEGNGMLISCMAGRIFSHIFYYSVK